MKNDTVTLELKGLDQMLKALKARPPVARIGVLGGGARTKKEGEKNAPSNATVAAAHEYGAPARGLPQRSFLRMPLTDQLNKEMEKSGALDKAVTAQVIKDGSVMPWLRKVATLAEGIVRGAFDTGGYGKWRAWKDSHYANNTGMLLVDTTQLRDSITSEVKEA